MGQCWPLQMPPTPKAVLISLADNANDQGNCWPSIATIAERTCFSERAVQGAIKWLEQASVLSADRSNGRHTRYWLTPSKFTGTSAREVHYIYRITHVPTGQFYVGSRTCACAPEMDVYFGSGAHSAWLMSEKESCSREILGTYPTRGEANVAETELLTRVIDAPLCLNKRVTNPENAGGNPRTSCTPQEMHPADTAQQPPQEMHQPPQMPRQPPQQVPSNRQEPSLTVKESNRHNADAIDATDRFDEFWAAYPRKEGRKDAAKAWVKLKPTADLLATILAALALQSKTPKWLEKGGQFIPYGSTYLNGERWNDQVPTVTQDVVVAGAFGPRGKQQQLEERNKRVADEWLAEQSAASQNQR